MDKELERSLGEIALRIEQIIMLFKAAFADKLDQIKSQANADPVSKRILELADGTRSAQMLKKEVATDAEVSEKTVERRLNELTSRGLLAQRRAAAETYYQVTNLF